MPTYHLHGAHAGKTIALAGVQFVDGQAKLPEEAVGTHGKILEIYYDAHLTPPAAPAKAPKASATKDPEPKDPPTPPAGDAGTAETGAKTDGTPPADSTAKTARGRRNTG